MSNYFPSAKDLSDKEVAEIRTFLNSSTGMTVRGILHGSIPLTNLDKLNGFKSCVTLLESLGDPRTSSRVMDNLPPEESYEAN